MSQITQHVNNIIEFTSWLSLKDIQKLSSQDRKIAKIAIQMQREKSTIVPKALKDERKLTLVENHLKLLHLNNPILKKIGIVKESELISQEVLKKKPSNFCARISRSIKNLFGRVSSKKLIAIYHRDQLNQTKTKAASGDKRALRLLTATLEKNKAAGKEEISPNASPIAIAMEKLKQLGDRTKYGFTFKSFPYGFSLEDSNGEISIFLGSDHQLYLNKELEKNFGDKTLNAAEILVQLIQTKEANVKSVSEERIKAAYLALKLSCSRLTDGKTEDTIKTGGENRTLAIANMIDALTQFAKSGDFDDTLPVSYRLLPNIVRQTFIRALIEKAEIHENIKFLEPKKTPREQALKKDLEMVIKFLENFPGSPFQPLEMSKPGLANTRDPNTVFFKPPYFKEGAIEDLLPNKNFIFESENFRIDRRDNTLFIEGIPYHNCSIHEQKAAYLTLLWTKHKNHGMQRQAAMRALALAIAMRPIDDKDPMNQVWGNSKNSRHVVSNVYRALMHFANSENPWALIEEAQLTNILRISIKDLFSRISKEDSDFRASIKNENKTLPPALQGPMQDTLEYIKEIPPYIEQKFQQNMNLMTFDEGKKLGNQESEEYDWLRGIIAEKLNEIYPLLNFHTQSFFTSSKDQSKLIIWVKSYLEQTQSIKDFPIQWDNDQPFICINKNNWDKFKAQLIQSSVKEQIKGIMAQADTILRNPPTYHKSKDGKYYFGKTIKNQQTIIYVKNKLAEKKQPDGVVLSFNTATNTFWKNEKEAQPSEEDLQILKDYLNPEAIRKADLYGIRF